MLHDQTNKIKISSIFKGLSAAKNGLRHESAPLKQTVAKFLNVIETKKQKNFRDLLRKKIYGSYKNFYLECFGNPLKIRQH